MKNIPAIMYHAAPICVHDSIDTEGLRSTFGEVYAAEKVEHALTFMSFRLFTHIHGRKEVELDGKTYQVPDLVQHDAIDVWVIDTSETDLDKWEIGSDHNPAFFGNATSWSYGDSIPRKALLGAMTILESDLMYD